MVPIDLVGYEERLPSRLKELMRRDGQLKMRYNQFETDFTLTQAHPKGIINSWHYLNLAGAKYDNR